MMLYTPPLSCFGDRGRSRRKVILLVSDGINGPSFNHHTYEDALNVLLSNNISVYGVALGRNSFHSKIRIDANITRPIPAGTSTTLPEATKWKSYILESLSTDRQESPFHRRRESGSFRLSGSWWGTSHLSWLERWRIRRAISPLNTIEYYASALARMGSSQQDWLRLFMVPGMAHCGGGPGPNQVNWMAALERWRESGIAPDRLIASRVSDNHVNMTRPICSYLAVAKNNGVGSTNDAANFACKVP